MSTRSSTSVAAPSDPARDRAPIRNRKTPFYATLWVQVVVGIAIAVLLGYFSPTKAVAMKPLGDAFIRLITMIISIVIFCTVVTGIAGMQDMRRLARVGGKAILYFETVSTLALLVGLIVGSLVKTGEGFNAEPTTLNAQEVTAYASQAKAQSVSDFLMHVIPNTLVDAFAKGDILQVLVVALFFGFAMSAAHERCRPLLNLIESLTHVVFGIVKIIMRFARSALSARWRSR